jgi:hypothetical protein
MNSNYDEYAAEQKELMRHIPDDWELSILRWDSAKTLLVDIIVATMVFLIVIFGIAQLGTIQNQQKRILDLETKMYLIEQKTAKLDVIYDYQEGVK